jgi:hypothetical protein
LQGKWVRGKNTLKIRPVKTIELMKTPKDNRCAEVRTHAKGYLLVGKERWQCQTKRSKEKCIVKCGGDAKISKVKRAINKNTHVEMDGVSATDKTSTTKMVLTTTTLNVALTLERPWLGCKKEKQRDSHTCLSSHSLFWLQACGLFCICGLWMAHMHYLCLLFVSLFVCDWKYFFSLALGPLQNFEELGIDTHSHNAGSSV